MTRSSKVISLFLPAVLLAGCTNPSQLTSVQPTTSSTPTLLTTNTSTPLPTASSTTPASYTLSDIASHSSASSCWIAINNQVYDVTEFIPNHPGGDKILSGCGKDMTDFMTSKHKPVDNRLPQFQIGSLKP